MKDRKQFEEHLMSIINKYVPILFLEKYKFNLHYGTITDNAIAECRFVYPYLDATINYSDKLYNYWRDKKDIRPYVVHEIIHLITDPLYCKATARFVGKDEIEDEREHLTDLIARIVLR